MHVFNSYEIYGIQFPFALLESSHAVPPDDYHRECETS